MPESTPPVDLPIACTLAEVDLARREEEIAREIFVNLQSVEELPNGYGFEFSDESTDARKLVEFIGFERQCCPFFTFELVFLPAHGPIWLRLRGPEGVKAVIEQMLPAGARSQTRKEEHA